MKQHLRPICRLTGLLLMFFSSGLVKAEEKRKTDLPYNHLFEIRNIEACELLARLWGGRAK